jgi:hypothetical protein
MTSDDVPRYLPLKLDAALLDDHLERLTLLQAFRVMKLDERQPILNVRPGLRFRDVQLQTARSPGVAAAILFGKEFPDRPEVPIVG